MSDDDGNITYLNTATRGEIPVEQIIKFLMEDADKFSNVLVLGFTKDGGFETRSSNGNVGDMLEMMELFKYNLLQGKYDYGPK